ncbi:MAG: transcription antitermination factor NusB [Desulfovibrionaceae bacterium]|nr:transcription antitermination factor NusB [Desulfovibrionaceae bacterium]
MGKQAAAKTGKRQGARREGRTLAFQVLYGLAFAKTPDPEQALELAVRDQGPCPEAALRFGRELLAGVAGHLEEMDALIQRLSRNWKLERIARVELAILRLALFEIVHTEIPLKAAINEAVELSKRFGDENSRNFINGILDAAAKEVEAGGLGVQRSIQAPKGTQQP